MLSAGTAACPSPEAEAFVRFCYQRRRVGWPELYDEMCAVATRGLYRGMGTRGAGGDRRRIQPVRDARGWRQLVPRIVTEEQAARRAARAAMIEASEAARRPRRRGRRGRRRGRDRALGRPLQAASAA